MSETKYESKITSAQCSAQQVYRVLSSMQNLERVRDLIPKDKIQEMEIEPDRVRLKVDGLGQKITIAIVDRIENDTIKFGAEGIPMQANFWIQMKEVSPVDTRLKLTVKADIPFMFKMMVDKKLQQGLDQAAEMLAQFPYAQWQ
ncbi:MAG: SRPBCC family protein [Paludibacteraceae bacterium]|nr:SRPBCC family protein [Paludibacteraceae bacterium]